VKGVMLVMMGACVELMPIFKDSKQILAITLNK